MVNHYPHIASITITSDNGRDAKGYPLPPSESTLTLVCRAEPNTSNAVVLTADGSAYNYKYIVYIKAGQNDVPVNSPISIALPEQTIKGIVKMYSKGQLNARLWL